MEKRKRIGETLGIALVFVLIGTMVDGLPALVNIVEASPAMEIRTWYDLDAIRNNLDGDYVLMNDLDSTTAGYEELVSETANEGKGWEPIGTENHPFTGIFNGQGYEICDLYINRPDKYYVGLFSYVDGIIQDVGVVNIVVTGEEGIGGLAGRIRDGIVNNSYSTGNVIGYGCVGGLVGQIIDGTVSNSYSTGGVTGEYNVGGLGGINWGGSVGSCYATVNVTGNMYVGGLVGENYGLGAVSNSYSTGSVTGNLSVGGLVGQNEFYATVSNSYSTGKVTGGGYAAGLVAWNEVATVSNSFWDTETSGMIESYGGGTGKTTAEMQDIATFSGAAWDIIAVNSGESNPAHTWNIVDGVTYPFLPTGKTGDANGDGVVDTGDITKVKRIYFELDPPTPCADINEDGFIDTGDITAIKLIYFGA
jgi:hypothetical protein